MNILLAVEGTGREYWVWLGYLLSNRGILVRFRARTRDCFAPRSVQTGLGVHQAFYALGTAGCCPESKTADAWSYSLHPVPRFRMSAALPALARMSLWLSRGQPHLYLLSCREVHEKAIFLICTKVEYIQSQYYNGALRKKTTLQVWKSQLEFIPCTYSMYGGVSLELTRTVHSKHNQSV
jgi:hypothetical protein